LSIIYNYEKFFGDLKKTIWRIIFIWYYKLEFIFCIRK